MKTALEYAIDACDTLMRKFEPAKLPPEGKFHYHQGVFLSGMYETYRLCGEEKYFAYMKAWIDSVFDRDGNIINHNPGTLDDIMPGILLFRILDATKDDYYEKCIASVAHDVSIVPKNREGGFWHKYTHKDQMWLDGLYMGGPFMAEYASRYHDETMAREVVKQALLMDVKTRDKRTGLMYHAWDGSRLESWGNPENGRSPEFWGRAMGWVGVAILNDLDFLPENMDGRKELIQMVVSLLENLCRYQAEDGRWYQVVDKGNREDNWLENSCTCLYCAALFKAVRLGLMDRKYLENAKKGFEGVINSLTWQGDDIQIGNVCVGTGVGDYSHYIRRPVSINDLHGAGAFLLMCTEAEKCTRFFEGK